MKYGIYYNGSLAEAQFLASHSRAKSRAFELIKAKGWDAAKVEVRQICNVVHEVTK